MRPTHEHTIEIDALGDTLVLLILQSPRQPIGLPGTRPGTVMQVIVWPSAVQAQPVPVPEMKTNPLGNVSVTVIVNVTLCPTPMVGALTVLVKLRSVTGLTIVSSSSVSLLGSPSAGVSTLTLLMTLGAAAAPTLTVSVILVLALGTSGPP